MEKGGSQEPRVKNRVFGREGRGSSKKTAGMQEGLREETGFGMQEGLRTAFWEREGAGGLKEKRVRLGEARGTRQANIASMLQKRRGHRSTFGPNSNFNADVGDARSRHHLQQPQHHLCVPASITQILGLVHCSVVEPLLDAHCLGCPLQPKSGFCDPPSAPCSCPVCTRPILLDTCCSLLVSAMRGFGSLGRAPIGPRP